jgi:ATP-dependent Clp protease, protease subunit
MSRNSYIQQNSDIHAAGGLVPMVVEQSAVANAPTTSIRAC